MYKLLILIFMVLFLSCRDKDKNKESVGYDGSNKEAKKVELIDLNNKGVGAIQSLEIKDSINKKMAEQGQTLFTMKCIACHKIEARLIGPKLSGVIKKRSPEWIMNMMLNTDEMLEKDPIAKQLLEKYKYAMVNMNLTEQQARALLEYLRTI